MTARKYYAVEWPYGRIAWSSEYGTPSTALAFATRAARDAWVGAGNAYTTQAGAREALTAAEVQRHHLEIEDGDAAVAEEQAYRAGWEVYLDLP